MMFLLGLVVFFLCGAGYVLSSAQRVQRLTTAGWQNALGKVHPVDMDQLRGLAGQLEDSKFQQSMTGDEIWTIVGGFKGLRRLKANATVMLNLALVAERSDVFVEQWNREEGVAVSQLIRDEALQLTKAIRKIQVMYFISLSSSQVAPQCRVAIESYDLIRTRLLSFYQKNHAGLLPQLQAVV